MNEIKIALYVCKLKSDHSASCAHSYVDILKVIVDVLCEWAITVLSVCV